MSEKKKRNDKRGGPKTGSAKAEPGKTEPVQTEPTKTEPKKAEPKKAEVAKAAPEKKSEESVVRLTLTLAAICAVCALLLGLVNATTKDRIQANKLGEKAAAMAAVLPAGTYNEVAYTGGDTTIRSLYRAGDVGYVVEVAPGGSFSGTLTILVGVDNAGAVTGVEITESGETKDLGDNAKKPEFRAQFVGLSGTVKVDKDGGAIESVSGATITSRAVCAGVTSALNAVAELGQGG